MCVSTESSLIIASLLLVEGIICIILLLRSGLHNTDKIGLLPFSMIPLIISAQEISEGLIWNSNARNQAAIDANFCFLMIVFPVFIPMAMIALELTRPKIFLPLEQIVWVFRCEIKYSSRLALLFSSLSAGLSVAVISLLDILNGIGGSISHNRIIYTYSHHNDIVYELTALLASLAIFAPILLSSVSHLSMYLVGIPLAFVAAISVAIYYLQGSAPVWCFLLSALSLALIKILVTEIGFRQRNAIEKDQISIYGAAPVVIAEI